MGKPICTCTALLYAQVECCKG
ncbi:hypothetical protein QLX08_001203 [Tetragonisca angustula]|uniref:Uncharacterized protein n=1 Tax=Tetragonisca angustula TaxID=166442 RepID=A0AAW1AG89_9HYME